MCIAEHTKDMKYFIAYKYGVIFDSESRNLIRDENIQVYGLLNCRFFFIYYLFEDTSKLFTFFMIKLLHRINVKDNHIHVYIVTTHLWIPLYIDQVTQHVPVPEESGINLLPKREMSV